LQRQEEKVFVVERHEGHAQAEREKDTAYYKKKHKQSKGTAVEGNNKLPSRLKF